MYLTFAHKNTNMNQDFETQLQTSKYDSTIWSGDESQHFQEPFEHVGLAKMDVLPVFDCITLIELF